MDNRPVRQRGGLILAALLMLAGGVWVWTTWGSPDPAPPPSTRIPMTDAAFDYGPGWTITPAGADPAEPADTWNSPAGVLTFDYTGQDLAMDVAVGNYWAYLLISVDGAPANRLPTLPGVVNSLGASAGYRPLLMPEAQTDAGPTSRWLPIHRAAHDGPHQVRVEVWRGWSQFPLRGVAVDALPPSPRPVWPGVGLILAGLWLGGWAIRLRPSPGRRMATRKLPRFPLPGLPEKIGPGLLVAGLLLAAGGTILDLWPITGVGLGLAGLAGLMRPALWLAGLLFGLPFYLYALPILPGRSLNLVEIGLYGGLLVVAAHRLLFPAPRPTAMSKWVNRQLALLGLLVSLALVAVFAIPLATGHLDVAAREWRTVFLAGALFALLMAVTLRGSPRPQADLHMLILAWVAGGTAMALIGLAGYVNGGLVVEAEGVRRLRSLYGSPNNLALYLERTVLVAGALALFGSAMPNKSAFFEQSNAWTAPPLWIALALPQLIALMLTFSKGALTLGLPAGIIVLGGGGWVYLARMGRSKRPLIWLGVAVGLMILGLLPSLGAERFQRILDVEPGSTGFFRVQLWRSAWQMALDHPLWGVGPDNFLYAYRSGYILPAAWQEPNLNHPHNLVLDLWTRIGLPGLLVAVVWLGMGVRRLLVHVRTDRNESAVLALGLLAAIAGALAHGLIDVSYALPDLMLVWVLMLSALEPVIGDGSPVMPQVLEGVEPVELLDGQVSDGL